MTKYNKRLDEILFYLTDQSAWDLIGITQEQANELSSQLDHDRAEAKQALTSLMKELVTEAKPGYMPISKYAPSIYSQGFNQAVDDFEQNLLKALEEAK